MKPLPVNWQYSIVLLTGTVLAVVIIGALYWAQVVFIPLALAVFFTFVLNPMVMALQRRNLGRIPSVMLVLSGATLATVVTIWIVGAQIGTLIHDLPNHTENLKEKIKSVRDLGEDGMLARLRDMYKAVSGELEKPADEKTPTDSPPPGNSPEQPAVVVVQPEGMRLPALGFVVGPTVEFLGQLALSLILVIFMLLNREDLRDRLIRLAGHGRITVTTKAFDEAGHRISRFLLMQAVVNGTYGFVLALGLFALGVPYAFLWGFLATVLRYIPYIGPWIAAIFPIGVTLIESTTWTQPLGVIGLFIVIELISNNVMEPYLYRQSVGVSEVALLVTAAFWTFLWGPVGLILSTPLTVCLVVLGRYVPQLEFLNILLSDEPVLSANLRYYQRLLARDEDEASELALSELKGKSFTEVADRVLIPTLTYAKRDREQEDISSDDENFVLKSTRELVENLEGTARAEAPADGPRVRMVVCPGRDRVDELAAAMFAQGLSASRWDLEVVPVAVLTSELLTLVEKRNPAVICIASLPPGGLAHTRYLCKKLRARFPDVHILVGRWGLEEEQKHNREAIREAGADVVCVTLAESYDSAAAWLPVLASQSTEEGKAKVDLPNSPAHLAAAGR